MGSDNISTTFNKTNGNLALEFCHPFHSVNFEQVVTNIPSIVNALWNILLATVATITNLLVFAAVRRTNSIRLPSKLLLLSLILTDLGAGTVAQPQFAALLIAKATNSPKIICSLLRSFYIVTSLFFSASLWTMTAISLDRYCAFFYFLKYNEIVTTKRVGMVLVFTWSLSLFLASASQWKASLFDYIVICSFPFCLILITVAYIKIYLGLRHHHDNQVQDQSQAQAIQQAGNTLNVAKYRRSASSMMWNYGLFLLCYLPYICFSAVEIHILYNFSMMCIHDFTLTLMLLNSSLNPIVYCFRLPDIRAEVMRTVQKILRQNPQHSDVIH